jgi:hypothetical protein
MAELRNAVHLSLTSSSLWSSPAAVRPASRWARCCATRLRGGRCCARPLAYFTARHGYCAYCAMATAPWLLHMLRHGWMTLRGHPDALRRRRVAHSHWDAAFSARTAVKSASLSASTILATLLHCHWLRILLRSSAVAWGVSWETASPRVSSVPVSWA